ncbi:MAG: sensor histidine kinase [Polaromonas sp.]
MLAIYSWAAHAGAVVSVAVTVVSMSVASRSWRQQKNPIDFAYMAACVAWLLYLTFGYFDEQAWFHAWAEFAAHVGYQFVMGGISFFLLVSASVTRLRVHALWMAQGVFGLLLLVLDRQQIMGPDGAHQFWIALNLICVSTLSFYLGLQVYRQHSYRCWLVFAASLLGLGICFEDFLSERHMGSGVTLTQYFYAFFLQVVWLLITNRAGRPEPAAVLGGRRTHSTWENVTGFFPDMNASALAVNSERRRIAQDLHDGVGSQLMNLLATLDTHKPEQQAIALILEQSLLDLKVMVDSIESTEGNVIQALGMLRYRVQHALDKLGIRMVWMVDVDGPLENFCGERALHVLRITQECISNTMRHAGASVIEVICRYHSESDCLQLEVHDNGRGIPSRKDGRPTGKGLSGLQRRADKLGGKLKIVTKAQHGTSVRLQVPLSPPSA